MGNILLNFSKFSLDKSFTSPNEMPDNVSKIYDLEEKETKTNQRRLTYIAIMFGVSTLIGLLFVIGNTVQLIVTGRLFEVGFVISLLIVALIALTGIVEFWFSRHLNASFNEIAGLKTKMITSFVAFFTIVVSNPDVSVVNILRSISRLI